MARIDDLNFLVNLNLDAKQNGNLRDTYQYFLRKMRPSEEEIDYIDREVAIRQATLNGAISKTGTPDYLPLVDIVNAFRGATPMARLQQNIKCPSINWHKDREDHLKAYIMACFSEIAYLHLPEFELPGHDRYKVFTPSIANRYLMRGPLRFDLATVMSQVADISVEIIVTRHFVYLVSFLNNLVIVAVRGTSNFRDWLVNLRASHQFTFLGCFHSGFWNEARLGTSLLIESVYKDQSVDPSVPVYVTGHSLGAAVASIVALLWPHLELGTNSMRTPYLFASPRWLLNHTDGAGAQYCYARPYDCVPHLPPKFLGYVDADSNLTMLPFGERRRSGPSSFAYTLSKLSISQHKIEEIRMLLGEVASEPFPESTYIDALAAKVGT